MKLTYQPQASPSKERAKSMRKRRNKKIPISDISERRMPRIRGDTRSTTVSPGHVTIVPLSPRRGMVARFKE